MRKNSFLKKNLALCLLLGAGLMAVFSLYLQPHIMLALDGFWTMCSAALR